VLANGLKLAVYGLSDVGLSREHNEDSISWDIDLGLIMLADGMGGHNAGEIASELAVTAIRDALLDVLTPEMMETELIKCDEALREAVVYANEEIHEQAHRQLEYAGMGTTVVITLFHDDKVTYAHVGDSRIYRLRQGELKQLTQDHSLVQEMIDNGYLSQEEAMISSSRNLITRALGIAPEVEVDVVTETLDIDDIYLLLAQLHNIWWTWRMSGAVQIIYQLYLSQCMKPFQMSAGFHHRRARNWKPMTAKSRV
jgi:serine/threonine protein phosphatase PrpC